MKFAVISASGSQHQVEEGKELLVDRLESKEGDKLDYEVLLFVDGENILVGTPVVRGVTVQAKVIGHERGNKIRVAKFTAKSRNRHVRGYRHDYTRLQVISIK